MGATCIALLGEKRWASYWRLSGVFIGEMMLQDYAMLRLLKCSWGTVVAWHVHRVSLDRQRTKYESFWSKALGIAIHLRRESYNLVLYILEYIFHI